MDVDSSSLDKQRTLREISSTPLDSSDLLPLSTPTHSVPQKMSAAEFFGQPVPDSLRFRKSQQVTELQKYNTTPSEISPLKFAVERWTDEMEYNQQEMETSIQSDTTQLVTETERRQVSTSKIISRHAFKEQRELETGAVFKKQKVLSPDEVKSLARQESYNERAENILQLKLIEKGKLERVRQAETLMKDRNTHKVWKQRADSVYEIIQLLKLHGFKELQENKVWPYDAIIANKKNLSTQTKRFQEHSNVTPTSDEFEEAPILESDPENFSNSKMTKSQIVKHQGKVVEQDKLNDFHLLFARFPDILTYEITDLRRKLHTFEDFQMDDIRRIILLDPRVLSRPANHVRELLEVFDDFGVENINEIVEKSPHLLATTSSLELRNRCKFIYQQIISP